SICWPVRCRRGRRPPLWRWASP
ncbi:hypothetical protein AZZ62_002427, partial [Klebsiella variicola]